VVVSKEVGCIAELVRTSSDGGGGGGIIIGARVEATTGVVVVSKEVGCIAELVRTSSDGGGGGRIIIGGGVEATTGVVVVSKEVGCIAELVRTSSDGGGGGGIIIGARVEATTGVVVVSKEVGCIAELVRTSSDGGGGGGIIIGARVEATTGVVVVSKEFGMPSPGCDGIKLPVEKVNDAPLLKQARVQKQSSTTRKGTAQETGLIFEFILYRQSLELDGLDVVVTARSLFPQYSASQIAPDVDSFHTRAHVCRVRGYQTETGIACMLENIFLAFDLDIHL
jgi:hypothetical protein